MSVIERRLGELQEEERSLQAAAFQHQERAATVQASLNQEAARIATALADVRRRIAECSELQRRVKALGTERRDSHQLPVASNQ